MSEVSELLATGMVAEAEKSVPPSCQVSNQSSGCRFFRTEMAD